MDYLVAHLGTLSLPLRLSIFGGIAIAIHLCVTLIRRVVDHFLAKQRTWRFQKLRSVATLTTSAIIFWLYFLAIGLILREFGISLNAYLASASVIALAIGFGSQGIVQDVVAGRIKLKSGKEFFATDVSHLAWPRTAY